MSCSAGLAELLSSFNSCSPARISCIIVPSAVDDHIISDPLSNMVNIIPIAHISLLLSNSLCIIASNNVIILIFFTFWKDFSSVRIQGYRLLTSIVVESCKVTDFCRAICEYNTLKLHVSVDQVQLVQVLQPRNYVSHDVQNLQLVSWFTKC